MVGPGGALFYPDIANGEIKRISFPNANQAPTARATAMPASGDSPLTVQFDGSDSSDGDDDDALTYAWDLDADGASTTAATRPRRGRTHRPEPSTRGCA